MMDTVTPGQAVVTKVIAEGALSYSYTGVDRGTGDIVITMPKRPAVAGKTFQNVTVDEYGLVIGGVVGSAEGYEPLIQAGAGNQVWHGDKQWKQLNTDDTLEGSLHLYYSDARARAALHAGANITLDSGTGTIAVATDPVLGSITLSAGSTPSTTANKLYNIGGSLYWNGMLVGSNYSLPVASATVLGGIKVGSGLSIDGSGVLTAQAQPYTLPVATTSVLGGVKQGLGVVIASDGTLSVNPLTRRTTFRIGNGSSNTFNCVHGFGTTGISVSIRRATGTRSQVSHDNYLTPGDESNSVTIAFPASNIPAVNEYEVTVIANNAVLASTTTLTGLQDVVLTNIINGQTLVYMNGSWVNGDMSGGSFALSGLSDVTVSGLSADQLLKFNGTKWVNSSIGTETILNANSHASVQWNAPQTASMRINGIVQAGAFAVADPSGTSAVEYTWQHQNGWFYAMMESNNDFVLGSYQDVSGTATRHPAMHVRVSSYTPYRVDFDVPLKIADGTPSDTTNALYSVSGALYWNGAAVGSGSGGYTLPTASATILGGIKVGANLSIDGNGVLSANAGAYTLPAATSSVLGGVKPSTGLVVDAGGVLTLSPTPGLNYIDFNTSYGTPAYQTGRLYWDVEEITLSLGLTSGSILQIGQELLLRALNNTGSVIGNGKVVYVSGSQGNRVTVALADATDDTKSKVVAVATQDVANNAVGFFTLTGLVHDIDTSAFTEGSEVWLGTTPGSMTQTRPAAPNAAVCLGHIVRSHATVGHLFVRITRGLKLEELGNVALTNPTDGQILKRVGGVWVNAAETGNYTLPTASASVLGGIKVGANLSIDGNGVLSATGGSLSGGAAGRLTYWTGASTVGSDAGLTVTQTSGTTVDISIGDGTQSSTLYFRAATNQNSGIVHIANGAMRWILANTATTMDYKLRAFDAAGAEIDQPIVIGNAAGSAIVLGGSAGTKRDVWFTQNINVASAVSTGYVVMQNTANPEIQWRATTGNTDEKNWNFYTNSGVFYFRVLNDAYTSANYVYSITRSGYVATQFNLYTELQVQRGVYIPSFTPSDTSNRLYSVGSALYWNGTAIGSGGAPSNMMTTDTNQTVTGTKTFTRVDTRYLAYYNAADNSAALDTIWEHTGGRFYSRYTASGVGHNYELGAYNSDSSVITPGLVITTDGSVPVSVDVKTALNANQGIVLASYTPSTRTNTLFNTNGQLTWSGPASAAIYADSVAQNNGVTFGMSIAGVVRTCMSLTDNSTLWRLRAFTLAGVEIDSPMSLTLDSAGTLVLGGSTNRTVSFTGNVTVAGTLTVTGDITGGNVILLTGTQTASGVKTFSSGIALTDTTPGATTDLLYKSGGALWWSGAATGTAVISRSFAAIALNSSDALDISWQHQGGSWVGRLDTDQSFLFGALGSGNVVAPAITFLTSGFAPYRADFAVPVKLARVTPADTTDALYNVGGVLHWNGASVGGGGSYSLPVATTTTLGGVKQGTGITIAGDGTLSVSLTTRQQKFVIGDGVNTVFNCVHGFGTTGVLVSIRRAVGTRSQVGYENYLTPGNESNSITVAFPANIIPATGEYEVTVIANNDVVVANNNVSSVTQTAHGFVVGDVVYLSAGTWTKAIASSVVSLARWMVVSVENANTFGIARTGWWDIGQTLVGQIYLSETTAGLVTTTVPTSITQPIGYGIGSRVWLDFGPNIICTTEPTQTPDGFWIINVVAP
jgi:hypothetical protein